MSRMYTLCLVGVMAVLLGAGCGGTRQRGSGSFETAWRIGWVGGGLTDCQAADVMQVDIDVQDLVRTGMDYHTAFNCLDYQDLSDTLPESNYSVALRAYDSHDQMVAEYVFPVSYPIYRNTVTPLPTVRLDVVYH